MSETMSSITKEDLVVTRIIDAPIELVWKAWTDPEYVMRWWGPKYYSSPDCRIDLRVGGKYVFAMRAPAEQGGGVSYSSGIYEKIVPLERLEFTTTLSDKDGNKIDPTSIGMPPDFPEVIRSVVTFKAKGSMTEIVITEYDWPVSQMMVYSYAGMQQSIDKMAENLAKG